MSDRVTIETGTAGKPSQVVGGALDGAPAVVRQFTVPPLLVLFVTPDRQGLADVEVQSPAGIPFASAVELLEHIARSSRAALDAGRAPW